MTVPILQRVLSLVPRPGLGGNARGTVTVVRLCGELDLGDASALQSCLSDIRWAGRPRSTFDLTELEFIDCACLSVLARHACGILAQGGTVAMAGPHGAVARTLAVTGLLNGLEVYDTAGQAAGDRACRTVVLSSASESALLPEAL